MKNKLYLLLLLLIFLLSGCSSFINLTETFKLSDNNTSYDNELTNESSSNNDESTSPDNGNSDAQDSEINQELFNYQTTIDSLYRELSEKDVLIDSLLFEVSKFKDNILIKDVGFPTHVEFARQTIDLTIERNLERFEKAYNSELRSAARFIPRTGRYFAIMDSIFTKAEIPLDTKYLA
ncbi:MAG: hypothetical protein WC155_03780, partial [Candidatus Cloacimonadales bacterium]